MFSPSSTRETSVVLTARFLSTTMTSADFSLCTQHSEISLGKMNTLVPNPATSTISALPSRVWTSVWCVTSSGLIASVCGSCSSVQIPQFDLLQFQRHRWQPCHLLSFRARPQRFRDSHPLGCPISGLYSPFKAHTTNMWKNPARRSHDQNSSTYFSPL